MLFLHWVGNRFLSLVTNVLYNTTLSDMETCYKLFDRQALDGITIKSDRFEFEPEITAKLLRRGYHIYEVPISYSGRDRDEGKKITWRDGFAALVGPRIENLDGSLSPSARTFPSLADALGHAFLGLVNPSNRFTRRYRMLDWDHAVPRDVDWVAGTCMLLRRSAFEAVGGFDERYFMYVEDVDLCWRLWQTGRRVAYEPAGRVVHTIGVSSEQRPYRMIAEHHRSLLRFSATTLTGPRRGRPPPAPPRAGHPAAPARVPRPQRKRA